MAIQSPLVSKAPDQAVWRRIEQRIRPSSRQSTDTGGRVGWWPWLTACVLLVAILAVPLGLMNMGGPAAPNSDYVAVLTDDRGEPRLTAMTLAGGETLWLQWDSVTLGDDQSAQLWAVSRRDGQTRPIAVFERADTRQLGLDQAARRLIADAEYLLLTEEGPGGSPLDQPSADLIARGVCVRLNRDASS